MYLDNRFKFSEVYVKMNRMSSHSYLVDECKREQLFNQNITRDVHVSKQDFRTPDRSAKFC